MKDTDLHAPLVSVTLPLAADSDPNLLKRCLGSISSQTHRDFEVLIFVSNGSTRELVDMAQDFPLARIFTGSLTKSAARNLLARRSKGKYMLYIDQDMELSPNLLGDCVSLALEMNSQAIIADQLEAPSKSFWRKCRALEWKLLKDDIGAGSPYFLLTSLFEEVGGFDESIDMWDDWTLTLKLIANGIRFDRVRSAILISDTTDLAEMFIRKYRRGQYIPALKEKYPDAPHIRFSQRFVRIYVQNWRILIRSPILSIGLAFLKIIDVLGLFLGQLRPIRQERSDGTARYFEAGTAKAFDDVRFGDPFNRYKHYREVHSLRELLDPAGGRVVEVGAGTGRITRELTNSGLRVTPIDPSPVMLREYRRKSSLPSPVLADGRFLPFKELEFSGAVSLRVIWHLPAKPDIERVIEELARVSTDFVVIDISNKGRWQHPFFRLLARAYFLFRPSERGHHAATQFVTLDEIRLVGEKSGLILERTLALDGISPLWLRAVPQKTADWLYPGLARLENFVSGFVPPGRYLIKFSTFSDEASN